MAYADISSIKRGFRLKSFFLIVFVFLFSFSECGRSYNEEDFRRAVEVAYKETLKNTGVTLRGFLFVLRYDSNPSANAVALFYVQPHRESFMFLSSRFKNPEELKSWLIVYIKENIEVRYE